MIHALLCCRKYHPCIMLSLECCVHCLYRQTRCFRQLDFVGKYQYLHAAAKSFTSILSIIIKEQRCLSTSIDKVGRTININRQACHIININRPLVLHNHINRRAIRQYHITRQEKLSNQILSTALVNLDSVPWNKTPSVHGRTLIQTSIYSGGWIPSNPVSA